VANPPSGSMYKSTRPAKPGLHPLSYEPGKDAQVDFGEAVVIMKGRPVTVQVFVGRLCFSKIPFLVASPNQQQEALFEGHDKAFDFFGGVPRTVWYDRMSQAMRKRYREAVPKNRRLSLLSGAITSLKAISAIRVKPMRKGLV